MTILKLRLFNIIAVEDVSNCMICFINEYYDNLTESQYIHIMEWVFYISLIITFVISTIYIYFSKVLIRCIQNLQAMNTRTRTTLVTFIAVIALIIIGAVAVELLSSTAASAQRYPIVGGSGGGGGGGSGDTKAGSNSNITSSGNMTSNTHK